MPGELVAPSGLTPAELEKDAVMAAEISDPLVVPRGASRIVWVRPSFERQFRPVCVDARRLPAQG